MKMTVCLETFLLSCVQYTKRDSGQHATENGSLPIVSVMARQGLILADFSPSLVCSDVCDSGRRIWVGRMVGRLFVLFGKNRGKEGSGVW